MKSFKFLDSIKNITKVIYNAVKEKIFKATPKVVQDIRPKLSDIVYEILINSPLYNELTEGQLLGELGFNYESRYDRINTIMKTISESVQVQEMSNGLGIEFFIISTDFSEALSLHEAFVITEKDQPLPWLEWMVERGEDIIIWNWSYTETVPEGSESRSHRGVMSRKGDFWRVPPQWSGYGEDTAFSRAVNDSLDYLEQRLGLLAQDTYGRYL